MMYAPLNTVRRAVLWLSTKGVFLPENVEPRYIVVEANKPVDKWTELLKSKKFEVMTVGNGLVWPNKGDVWFRNTKWAEPFPITDGILGPQFQPTGMEALWMMGGDSSPPYNEASGRFDFTRSQCLSTYNTVWIDVGAHTKAEIPNPAVPVIGFEPQLKFWSELRNQHPCVFAIPAAVSATNGFVKMHGNAAGHTSSLLKTVAANVKSSLGSINGVEGAKGRTQDWTSSLASTTSFNVFSVRLDDVIQRAAVSRIAYLKVDAQGYDLDVVKSAGDWIRFVDKVKMESKADGAPGMYEGQPAISEIKVYMQSKGFQFDRAVRSCCGTDDVEMDLYFQHTSRTANIPADCPYGPRCKKIS